MVEASVEREPDPSALNQQAISFIQQGKFEKARARLEQALRLKPDYPNAHNNLGNILLYHGRFDAALECYERALRLKPDYAEAYNNRGNALSALGRYPDALADCQRALRLKPNTAPFYHCLGNVLKGLGKLTEAAASYQRALELDPNSHEARNALGLALVELKKLDDAAAHYREALRIKPDFAEAYHNLGIVFMKRSNWTDAMVLFRQAIRLQPKYAEAYYQLGYVFGHQSKLGEAAKCFRHAIRLKPDWAEAHFALALSLLPRGDLEHGLPEYEWRWRLKGGRPLPQLPQPVWDGSPLRGRTILLFAEGGLGNAIHFVRYAAIVKQYGGTVIVACHRPLLPLLAKCRGIDQLIAADSAPPAFDVQAPLMSVPGILKTSLSRVPAEVPYLFPDANLQKKWQRKLSPYPGFKVGIAWQGKPDYPGDRERSIPLVHFAPLAHIPSVCLLSLQKGPGAEQLPAVADQFRVHDLGSRLDEKSAAFVDTAAVMKSLDLVITSDTAIAHLAGALGVPVWVALSFVPEWRWLLQREDSPWYPTMRLFRQTKAGDWDGVFARIALELSNKLADLPA